MQTEQRSIPFHPSFIGLSHPGPLSPALITPGTASDQIAEGNPDTLEPAEIVQFANPKLHWIAYPAWPIPSQEDHDKGFPGIPACD